MSGYVKRPAKRVDNSKGRVFRGREEILDRLSTELSGDSWSLVLETYPGVCEEEMRGLIEALKPDMIVSARQILKDADALEVLLQNTLTDDRVFGKMYYGELTDFIDPVKADYFRAKIASCGGKVAVYGLGASLLCDSGLCVYADMSRWEIQLRYRSGMSNYFSYNPEEDILKKFKQGYFLEWRIADKLKAECMDRMAFFIDANRDDDLVMISRDLFEEALIKEASEPFRVVPYFDPGVWGGQWMKKVCGLDPYKPNYAWSFDGVPEENSICFDFDGTILEMPAMNPDPLRLSGYNGRAEPVAAGPSDHRIHSQAVRNGLYPGRELLHSGRGGRRLRILGTEGRRRDRRPDRGAGGGAEG